MEEKDADDDDDEEESVFSGFVVSVLHARVSGSFLGGVLYILFTVLEVERLLALKVKQFEYAQFFSVLG
ncbi:hypothetical protein M0802_008122 [Mischocyttarus mexicanus]|nr:hypothetical protein M0802_008122 [Mischocyttarus mexicanus]